MSPRSAAALLLSAVLMLTACDNGGGTVTPPTPTPPTPPTPAPIPTQYLPTPGFWSGTKAAGPWCAGKPSKQTAGLDAQTLTAAANAVQAGELFSRPTPGMTALSGLSADLKQDLGRPGAQSAATVDTALLLPTDADASAGLKALRATGFTPRATFGYWLTADLTPTHTAELLRAGLIQYAERVPELVTEGLPTPNDATLQNQEKYLPMMNTQAAWDQLELGCDHPVIAVIDTGWIGSTEHAEYNLVPKSAWFSPYRNEKGNADAIQPAQAGAWDTRHGTAVASVIAMTTNGGGKGAGVSYNLAKVLPIVVSTPTNEIDYDNVAYALMYALGGVEKAGKTFTNPYPADVINLSFGSLPSLTPGKFLQSYFDYAASKGTVIVASAGNELSRGTSDTAGLNNSIGVAGVMFNGERWVDPYQANFGSNYGPGVDVAAPAMAVPIWVEGQATYWSGTSFASPWAAAQVAMWMYANQQHHASGSRTQGLKGDALYTKLLNCFAAVGSNRGVKDEYLGYGKLDTARLVSLTETACR
ncbi:S8 family peptidase [Deinococcus sp. UR1]|uniref:S8 family peptidase n=1 Tax=Deinococcus sp. UR1 TaxID=1704277 RepID=UPI000C18E83F|nr:S8/S53 family peptidase [Deinococcus sp. UR1]PIG95639.1 hypothetical protein AMD26_019980 [Deinococcus sp. UR1]